MADVAGTIINGLGKAWEIVKDGKPVSSAKGIFCQAMPENHAFTEFAGWKTTSKMHTISQYNQAGTEVVFAILKFDFMWGGQIKGVPGMWLTNFNAWCSNSEVKNQWKLNIDATVAGPPFNAAGGGAPPIGGITLEVSWEIGTFMDSGTEAMKITATGDGKFTRHH
jgi:hypothetical protein